MDHKTAPFETVRVNDVKIIRVHNGFVYFVKTGETDPPARPKEPVKRQKLGADDVDEYLVAVDKYDQAMLTWKPTEYWSSPVAIRDSELGQVLQRIDGYDDSLNLARATMRKLEARIDAFVPATPVRPPLGYGGTFNDDDPGIDIDAPIGKVPVGLTDSQFSKEWVGAPAFRETMRDYVPFSKRYPRPKPTLRLRLKEAFRAFVLELY
jgi:hypothetical protein